MHACMHAHTHKTLLQYRAEHPDCLEQVAGLLAGVLKGGHEKALCLSGLTGQNLALHLQLKVLHSANSDNNDLARKAVRSRE